MPSERAEMLSQINALQMCDTGDRHGERGANFREWRHGL